MRWKSIRIATLLTLCCALSSHAQLVSGTAPAMPIRGVGINEGFTDLPGFSLGWPTTVTAGDIAGRGYHVVKIWPIYQQPAQLAPIFNDPRIDVVIYRPLHNSQQLTECGGTTGLGLPPAASVLTSPIAMVASRHAMKR